MYRRIIRRALPAGILAAALAATVAAAPGHARQPDPAGAQDPVATTPVTRTLAELARQLAGALDRHDDLLPRVADGPVDLTTVAPGSAFARAAADADEQVRHAKGLPGGAGSLLQVRLADPAMAPALQRGAAPVVAPAGSDDAATSVTGYGPDGAPVVLDAAELPQRPVLLVEVDMDTVVPAGLAVLRDTLAAYGLTTADSPDATTGSGYWATKVTAVRVGDVQEPWFKGAAEIFSIVGGFDLDGEATVDVVDMPYLDDPDTTYFPNQLLVHFNDYKYDLADVVMMEDDGDTNYQALAQALVTALLAVTDLGMYTPLVDPILNAIPGSWWTDDPDYVESWYTLATTSEGRLHGASANGWLEVEPHFVEEL